MTFCDAHLHLNHCESFFPKDSKDEYICVNSCHDFSDLILNGRYGSLRSPSRFSWFRLSPPFSEAELLKTPCATTIVTAFQTAGIHPQEFCNGTYTNDKISFLKSLAENHEIAAIGECGFDYFTPELKKSSEWQENIFSIQLELALEYKLPLVLHLRKSINKVFEYSGKLKKLPAVIFHSFSGSVHDALSILNHGINGYFSFGKPLLNGKKSAVQCVGELSLDHLLLETDAPFQTLKNEKETFPEDICRVYEKASEIRNVELSEIAFRIEANFRKAYSFYEGVRN